MRYWTLKALDHFATTTFVHGGAKFCMLCPLDVACAVYSRMETIGVLFWRYHQNLLFLDGKKPNQQTNMVMGPITCVRRALNMTTLV
jgi:hypothetical protein